MGRSIEIDTNGDVVRRSVQAVLRNQRPNGAIIASPDFVQYRFCWLRDGSFSAYSLDLAGEHEASDAYHEWVNDAVLKIAPVINDVIAARETGMGWDVAAMPPARFALDGSTVIDDWPNFQIDGYGTWLWSLGRHLDLTGVTILPSRFESSVDLAARYLSAFALSPCYDVWEESGNDLHTSTLASVYGGLVAASRLLGRHELVDRSSEVRARVSDDGARCGHFVKSSANRDVDGSLVWLGAPFGVVDATDETLAATVTLIERRLNLGGGIRRYATDVYFGSGAWPVLTASLGWHYAAAGDLEGAVRCLNWITSHFDPEGRLGEQYGGEERDPANFRAWVERWGAPAQDLTWSHAMYVVLSHEINQRRDGPEGGSARPAVDVTSFEGFKDPS